jgi:hypothetical protein
MLREEKFIPKKFPSQKFNSQVKLVTKLEKLAETYRIYGKEIKGTVVEDLVNLLHGAFLKGTVQRETLLATVTDLQGKLATGEFLKQFFRKVAANTVKLMAGKPLTSLVPENPGWTCIEIKDIEYGKTPTGERTVSFQAKAISGNIYGNTVRRTHFLSGHSVDIFLYKLGCTRKGSTNTPRETVQLRLWADVHKRKTTDGEYLSYGNWTVDDQCKAYNRKIIKLRRSACPEKYTWPCAKCPIGYDKCPAGCRAISLEIKQKEEKDNGLLPKQTTM